MKMVKLEILAVRDGEIVSGVILKQRKRNNDYWVNEESITINSNDPGAKREMLLDDDQRIIIEGQSSVVVVFDKAQSAAVPVPRKDLPQKASPVIVDGREDPELSPPGDVVERNMSPQAFTEAQQQERRDAAITAARQKLAEDAKKAAELKNQQNPDQKPAGTQSTEQKPPEPAQSPHQVDTLKDSHQVKNEPTTAQKPVWTPGGGSHK